MDGSSFWLCGCMASPSSASSWLLRVSSQGPEQPLSWRPWFTSDLALPTTSSKTQTLHLKSAWLLVCHPLWLWFSLSMYWADLRQVKLVQTLATSGQSSTTLLLPMAWSCKVLTVSGSLFSVSTLSRWCQKLTEYEDIPSFSSLPLSGAAARLPKILK